MFLNNPWAKEQVSKEIRKNFKLSDNENTTYQICEVKLKQCLEENMSLNACIRKKERPQMNTDSTSGN